MWTFKEIMLYIVAGVFVFTMIYSAPQIFPNTRVAPDPDKKISAQLWENIQKNKK